MQEGDSRREQACWEKSPLAQVRPLGAEQNWGRNKTGRWERGIFSRQVMKSLGKEGTENWEEAKVGVLVEAGKLEKTFVQ